MGLRDRLGGWFRRADTAAAEEISALAAELVDHLTIHRPQPWTQLTIRCRQRKGELRVASYDMVVPGEVDETPRYLMDDNGARTAFVSVAIERLADALCESDEARDWSGEHLEVRRVGDRFTVVAIGAEGEVLARVPALRERDRLLTPRHIERLEGLHETIEQREEALAAALERGGATAHYLGTHSQDRLTWTWAWADGAVRRDAASRSRTLRERGRGLFGQPVFQASEPFAMTVAHLASARLGGAAFGRLDERTGDTVYFCVMV